ncbi:MAG: MBL fold metallo-hydrolase [Gemmatimonadota bacterium]|jgi:glyoxylase-like metal-dependent hydrolase (beta-lactamase superfamily II)
MSDIRIQSFTAPGFQENGYVVWRAGSDTAVAIDPGSDPESMLALLKAENLRLEAILLTHAHVDHVEGVPALRQATGAPIWLHPDDRPLYDAAADQAAWFGMRIQTLPPIDHEFAHGQKLSVAGLQFEVRHVPGHSPGHVILYLAEAGAALVGDVIFFGSVGRTDLPGGSFPRLAKGIRAHVFTLPEDTVLHTGHGPDTDVGHERATNPFLVPQYGGGLA